MHTGNDKLEKNSVEKALKVTAVFHRLVTGQGAHSAVIKTTLALA